MFDEAPIVVAANRDERLDRPSHPPRVTATSPAVLAPGDERAGGTWIGVNDRRLFAGVTNRWVSADVSADRSRGLLVRDVLESGSVEEAIEVLERAIKSKTYDGFNLLLAERKRAVLAEFDEVLRRRELSPGVHVVVNTGADGEYAVPAHRSDRAAEQGANADRVRAALEPEATETAAAWIDRASAVLADHDYGACIHEEDYGTVSQSLLTVFDNGTVTYRYADGPPCETTPEPADGHL